MRHDRHNPEEIIRRIDAGQPPKEIGPTLGVGRDKLYHVLRQYRPRRPRAPRPLVSPLRDYARALRAEGIRVARIAKLLGISRARAYKLLDGASDPGAR